MTPHIFWLGAAATAIISCTTDLHDRRIPNWLTLGSALVAFIARGIDGWSSFGLSAAGWSLALGLTLPLFVLRGLGGGDVKLLAALGAWLGSPLVVTLVLATFIAGGVVAAIVAIATGYFRQAITNVGALVMHWRVAGFSPHPTLTLDSAADRPRLPFSIPMAAGLLVTLWLA